MKDKIFQIIAIMLLAACAAQSPPSGGPEDKTPPSAPAVVPADGTVNLSSHTEISFLFDEPVSEASVRKSITLFPLDLTSVRIKVRRNRVKIQPESGWKKNQVYTLVLDRGIKDLRGNGIEESINHTFSTGSFIPEGSIVGEVPAYLKEDRLLIGLAGGNISVDSVFSHLLYLTETDKLGFYEFRAVPPGEYTLGGILDNDRSRTYSPDFDGLALPENPRVVMGDSSVIRRDFGLIRGNFLPIRLLRVENLYPRLTRLKFSKIPVPPSSAKDFLVDGVPADSFRCEADEIFLYHHPLHSDTLIVSVPALRDTLNVYGMAGTDTVTSAVLQDTAFSLSWDDNVLLMTPPTGIKQLSASLADGGDTSEIVMNAVFPGRFIPGAEYDGKDVSGILMLSVPENPEFPDFQKFEDTLNIRYDIPDDSGRVIIRMPENFPGPAAGLILQNSKMKYMKIAEPGRSAVFENVFAGKYSLWYYIDSNKNGKQDRGTVNPFNAPEIGRVSVPDLQVRARWDTEIDFVLSPPGFKKER